jgi:hypothetical protein
MADYLSIPPDRIRVAPLGVSAGDLTPAGRTRQADDPFVVGYFARVAPEKSLHLLAEAYRIMRQERGIGPARLEAAGYIAPEHRPYLQQIERELQAAGLGGEFHYHGTLDRAAKVAFFQSIDVLSVPSVYKEPKGLYLLEAMACDDRYSCRRGTRRGSPTASPRSATTRSRRATWGSTAPPACSSTTPSRAWPIASSRSTGRSRRLKPPRCHRPP